ncbi:MULTISPECIES: sulfite exporter TauE/SafE family protein [Rhodopseudomonas]|uniref:Probable membrane transporter protein n=1 Tax=Rhodopseudomonas palustris TaxID=1076 RepID=A0A0D7EBT8_RHOPL|nr:MULTISPECIES: sulfite exporter TauE/SafE family protein [Rhodopseudomonas]KIZ37042.1 membrane protein [Rhodopseudomonas palustris]MDF3810617.1 sulfite exporter TauE/SafE family protein [Rhodopseudomonas sp. BAL398]WOK16517.1 sulfite exporter TauE/SafE family protein [Rhodopseudomonas sp. BAL398]
MPIASPDVVTVLSGGMVGFILALIGGGGSVLAVPLLVYVVGVKSPHVAIGTSAIAVAISAFANMLSHWARGNVRWPCAIVFSAAGIGGALAGATIAKQIDGQKLLILFGMLMIVIGVLMSKKRGGGGDASIRLSRATARAMLPKLIGTGFGVGILSGFFGIGGGFLIVPGLILATGMPLTFAIGTSLVAVVTFGASTAASYAVSGLIDWRLAGVFIAGGLLGGLVGIATGRIVGKRDRALRGIFAAVVVMVGLYVCYRGVMYFL